MTDTSEVVGPNRIPKVSWIGSSTLLRLGLILFAISILSFETMIPMVNPQPDYAFAVLLISSLGAVGVALIVGGILDFVLEKKFLTWKDCVTIGIGSLLGSILLFASASFPFYGFFEVSYVGFPMPFMTSVALIGGPYLYANWVPFFVDFAFWTGLSLLGVRGILGLIRQREARHPLDGFGVAALLTMASYPVWGVLVQSGVAHGALAEIGPAAIPFAFAAPGLLVGAFLLATRKKGTSMVLFSTFLMVAILTFPILNPVALF